VPSFFRQPHGIEYITRFQKERGHWVVFQTPPRGSWSEKAWHRVSDSPLALEKVEVNEENEKSQRRVSDSLPTFKSESD